MRIPDEFWSTTVQAIAPRIIYDGAFPQRSRDYYRLARGSWNRAYVYLLYGSDDNLLYVGRTHRPGNRFDKHRRRDWWPEVAALVLLEVEGENADEAHALVKRLELRAIRTLYPELNVAGVLR